MSYAITSKNIPVPFRSIVRLNDNSFIPMDETNKDYQEYLDWLAQGNTPEEFSNGL
jgi:hypothetical protein